MSDSKTTGAMAVFDAAKKLDQEMSFMSWGGFNVAGDKKSIEEVRRLLNCEERLLWFERHHQERMKATISKLTSTRRSPRNASVQMQESQTETTQDRVGLAHKIATHLWDAGFRGPDGITVLSMAMGIYMDAHEGAHRNLKPISDAMLAAAQITFDAFQEARSREAGNA